MDWYPGPDEDLLFRTAARFATGQAPSVAGSRWFRDDVRGDIQGDLPGWPPGPRFALRGGADRAAQRTGRGFLVGVPLIANLIANLGGVSGSPFGDISVRGTPEEKENEVDDFPVLWAAPGTLARTVPWQLDPARRPEGYRTDVVLTDRRLLFLGVAGGTLDSADVLWETARDVLAGARRMNYSESGGDIRITFTDGSWIRLHTNAARLAQLINGAGGMLTEMDLTDGQRYRLREFRQKLPKNTDAPAIALLRSGVVRVVYRTGAETAPDGYETHTLLMDASGGPARARPGDM
ncbi:hypothetical protein AB0436_24310 [Streptomyces sp. NPDC051322]|uniref:hypothetical protein n=1 Tax=Streptomyces sp. NPDC051322 TaxID=3154645 RepID=UPI00344CE501